MKIPGIPNLPTGGVEKVIFIFLTEAILRGVKRDHLHDKGDSWPT